MEEWVGQLWHKWITRAAGGSHPAAAVSLKSLERSLGIYFRALGGDPGLRLAGASEDRHGARRRLLARIAGSGERMAMARRDRETLRLPPNIDAFPDPELNRDLYFWLAALAAAFDRLPAAGEGDDAFVRNQAASRLALAEWPGLKVRYERLLAAMLARRIPPERLPPAESVREHTIRRALADPGSETILPVLPAGTPEPEPVLLWLHADGLQAAERRSSQATHASGGGESRDAREKTHRASQVEAPREKNGLMMFFRAESLLSVAEFIKVNRATDDDDDPDAATAAADLEQLALAGLDEGERVASRVRFDLDLPSAAEDDTPLGAGIPLPEWDYRKGLLHEDHVRVQDMLPRQATSASLPPHLVRTAKRLRQQFAALQPGRRWLKAQPDGSEIDLDAVVRATTDQACGRHPGEQLHLSLERRERDLACLVLADLSLSTDAWVSSEARVIDVIRDALLLFGEALGTTGDAFALCGFSSIKRQQVRFQRLKDFGEPFDNRIRGRIQAIRPGYYTRMGAAIRRASQLLGEQAAARRILLILSDGKPNDLDIYDSRYGIEDTRAAVVAARRQGLLPFCLTIDREGGSYLSHLFGPGGFAVLRKPEELPLRLPMFYAQLTR